MVNIWQVALISFKLGRPRANIGAFLYAFDFVSKARVSSLYSPQIDPSLIKFES